MGKGHFDVTPRKTKEGKKKYVLEKNEGRNNHINNLQISRRRRIEQFRRRVNFFFNLRGEAFSFVSTSRQGARK